MAISIVECKRYEINHLRRQDTLKKVPSEFYFKMISRQSDHNDVFFAKLKHKLRHEILELLETSIPNYSSSIIINNKTMNFFQLRSVLLQGFTLVAAMLMMVIA